MNEQQLKECILDLAVRANELNEHDISIVLFTLAGAISTGDNLSLPTFAALCQSFAQLELERINGMFDDENTNN